MEQSYGILASQRKERDHMDTMKTGSYLAALRKDAGMTQQEVADRLGVSNKTISKWESGGGFPDIAILPALAELYGVTADDILAGEAVRQSTGGRQVEQYLAQRYGLRWRIGYAVAALCLLAAVLFPALRLGLAAAGGSRGGGMDRLGPVRQGRAANAAFDAISAGGGTGVYGAGEVLPLTIGV